MRVLPLDCLEISKMGCVAVFKRCHQIYSKEKLWTWWRLFLEQIPSHRKGSFLHFLQPSSLTHTQGCFMTPYYTSPALLIKACIQTLPTSPAILTHPVCLTHIIIPICKGRSRIVQWSQIIHTLSDTNSPVLVGSIQKSVGEKRQLSSARGPLS